jgi:ABC-2 type transport system permease protein
MQAGMFVLVLMTTSYAPLELLTGWLHTVAEINPVTQVLELVRQGFVPGEVTWAATWPGLVALAGLGILFAAWALRGMNRMAD